MNGKNELRPILERELNEVKRQIAALEESTSAKPDYGLGQGDPAITRWEMDKALLENLRKREETLVKAMSGKAGRYGICEKCGQPIHPDRLAVLPDTRICVSCARSKQ